MDSTKDGPRPGTRKFELQVGADELANSATSATGENVGPERKTRPWSEDVPSGQGAQPGGASTSDMHPPLGKKPEKGSRLDSSL